MVSAQLVFAQPVFAPLAGLSARTPVFAPEQWFAVRAGSVEPPALVLRPVWRRELW